MCSNFPGNKFEDILENGKYRLEPWSSPDTNRPAIPTITPSAQKTADATTQSAAPSASSGPDMEVMAKITTGESIYTAYTTGFDVGSMVLTAGRWAATVGSQIISMNTDR